MATSQYLCIFTCSYCFRLSLSAICLRKGFDRAQRYDSIYFLVGVIEFGYFSMELIRLFGADIVGLIAALLSRRGAVLFSCVLLYYLYARRNASEE